MHRYVPHFFLILQHKHCISTSSLETRGVISIYIYIYLNSNRPLFQSNILSVKIDIMFNVGEYSRVPT